jgi:hypothetical protein
MSEQQPRPTSEDGTAISTVDQERDEPDPIHTGDDPVVDACSAVRSALDEIISDLTAVDGGEGDVLNALDLAQAALDDMRVIDTWAVAKAREAKGLDAEVSSQRGNQNLRASTGENQAREQEWQPIETAPPDVTALFYLDWARDIRERLAPPAIERWYLGKRGSWSSVYRATHWQPLKPPSEITRLRGARPQQE